MYIKQGIVIYTYNGYVFQGIKIGGVYSKAIPIIMVHITRYYTHIY